MNNVRKDLLYAFIKEKDFFCKDMVLLQNNKRVIAYVLDGKFILRLSEQPLNEVDKLLITPEVDFAQKVNFLGILILIKFESIMHLLHTLKEPNYIR